MMGSTTLVLGKLRERGIQGNGPEHPMHRKFMWMNKMRTTLVATGGISTLVG